MRELTFIIHTILALIVGVFLLRLLLQLVRADFRNPLTQAIVRLTNPVILPLRKVLPPLWKLDTASVVAVLLMQMLQTGILFYLSGGGAPGVLLLLALAAVQLIDLTLLLYIFAIFVYVLLSWVSTNGYSPLGRVLNDLCDPVLKPFRRAIPTIAGLDLSPAIVLILIWVLRMILNERIAPALVVGL